MSLIFHERVLSRKKMLDFLSGLEDQLRADRLAVDAFIRDHSTARLRERLFGTNGKAATAVRR